MSHTVFPSRRCVPVKREVVQDPVVDFLHWQSFGWGIFDSHEDEARERVRWLGSRVDLSNNNHYYFRDSIANSKEIVLNT